MEIISRKEAIGKGLKRYFTGKPCSKGHLSERYVSNPRCIECGSIKTKSDSYKLYQKSYNESYRKINKPEIDEKKKEYYINNKEKCNKKSVEYSKNHPDIRRSICKKYSKNHKGRINAHTANRRSVRLNRTPAYADLSAIGLFYKNCPPGYSVDHIIPLQGKLVSGFHIETNLQYLTISENSSKGNKFNAY